MKGSTEFHCERKHQAEMLNRHQYRLNWYRSNRCPLCSKHKEIIQQYIPGKLEIGKIELHYSECSTLKKFPTSAELL